VTTVAQLGERLRTLFTDTADTLGRASGFVERASKLTGALFAQSLVFGFLANPDASLSALTQAAATAGVRISAQGLDKRCTSTAAGFLEQLLAAAVAVLVQGAQVAIPLLQRFSAVELLDSSTIVLPAALADWWPGCGGSGSPAQTSAALKIHVRYNLSHGTLTGPLLTDGRTHESTTPLQTDHLPAGALRVADLGFFDLAVFAQLDADQSYFLSRLHQQTALFDQAGQRCSLLGLLGAGPVYDLPVTLGCQQRLPARLLAVRVPTDVANQRRRQIRAAARKHGRTPTAEVLARADWTLLVTNAPATLLTVDEALALQRARWQLELLFRLWKEHGKVDESRSGKPWQALCHVFAKLLAVLVQHWIILTGCWQLPNRSLVKAGYTVRARALELLDALAESSLVVRTLTSIHRCLVAGCRLNSRKTHPNTYQLLGHPELLGLG
jgi:hypothetical protein